MFTNPVGVTERIEAAPVHREAGKPDVTEPITGSLTWASSDPAIATVTVNAGAPSGLQVDVKGLAPGTVTITGTGQDVQSPPHSFSDSFSYVVTAPVTPQANGLNFTDMGPV